MNLEQFIYLQFIQLFKNVNFIVHYIKNIWSENAFTMLIIPTATTPFFITFYESFPRFPSFDLGDHSLSILNKEYNPLMNLKSSTSQEIKSSFSFDNAIIPTRVMNR